MNPPTSDAIQPKQEETIKSPVSCLGTVIFFIAALFVIVVPFVRHVWIFAQSIDPSPELITREPPAALIAGLVLILPLGILSFLFPQGIYKATFQSWVFILVYSIALIPAYLFDLDETQAQSLVIMAVTVLFVAGFRLYDRFFRQNEEHEIGYTKHNPFLNNISIGLLGAVSAFPWLKIGALGSLLDTLLAIMVAISISLVFSSALKISLPAIKRLAQISKPGGILFGFFSISSSLYLCASALSFHFSGLQILLMIYLPVFTIPILLFFVFEKTGSDPIPSIGILFGIVSGIPLMLLDPDELVLVLNSSEGEILFLALRAVFVGIGVVATSAIIIKFLFSSITRITESGKLSPNFIRSFKPTFYIPMIILFAGISTSAYYITEGQPGFYGEHYFVILKSQADLRFLDQNSDYQERKRKVYQTLTEHALETQNDIIKNLERWNISYRQYYLVNALEVAGNPFLKWWLLSRPEIDRVLDNPILRPLPALPKPIAGIKESIPETLWNLQYIHVPEAQEEFNVYGEGIVIGQADSGVDYQHPELYENYRGYSYTHEYNWYDPWNHSTKPVDPSGHGTHTLGTIVGKNIGIAPAATWIACSNLARNLANPALYLDCMQFLFAPYPPDGDPFKDGKPELGAHIFNNSWGCPELEGCDADTFITTLRALKAAGIFFVASAGNDGPDCGSLKYPPSIYFEAFSVGAINEAGNLAPFSSIGPAYVENQMVIKPDLLAPGVEIFSALPDGKYGSLSGTSMAGPHVAGAVALLWSMSPDLIGQIELTTTLLRESAASYEGVIPQCPNVNQIPSNAYGYGILDVFALLQTQQ